MESAEDDTVSIHSSNWEVVSLLVTCSLIIFALFLFSLYMLLSTWLLVLPVTYIFKFDGLINIDLLTHIVLSITYNY